MSNSVIAVHANCLEEATPAKPTKKQGQVLSYLYYYTKINRRPPAEADIAAYFGMTWPSAHQMIVRLETNGFISRTPGVARSVRVLLKTAELPPLE